MPRNYWENILENVGKISARDISLPASTNYHGSVSIGGVLYDPFKNEEQGKDTFIGLLACADEALYASKGRDKNCYTQYLSD